MALVLAANRRGDAHRDRQHAFDPVVGWRRVGTWVLALDPLEVLVPKRLAFAAELDRGDGGEGDVELALAEADHDVVAVPAQVDRGCAALELDVFARAVQQVFVEVLVEVAQLLGLRGAGIELRTRLAQPRVLDVLSKTSWNSSTRLIESARK